jgi:hypothetical protein
MILPHVPEQCLPGFGRELLTHAALVHQASQVLRLHVAAQIRGNSGCEATRGARVDPVARLVE